MTREETIKEACAIISLAYNSIGDYSLPSDGFCKKCEKMSGGINLGNYQNAGEALAYVRLAVMEKLKNDGYKVANGFDPLTGKDIEK